MFSFSYSALPRDYTLVVWLGNPFFSRHLLHASWRLAHPAYQAGVLYTWQSILELTGGEKPDLVVAADASTPPFLLGVEHFPCLTAFYSVDAHIHSWQPVYAQAFDFCLVSLRGYLPAFRKGRLDPSRLWWSPPYAPDEARPGGTAPEKEWDLLFVGTVRRDITPARYAFFQELRERFPGFHATGGDFASLFPRARLVLNECSGGELNFRVFEALGCGACLLTPDIGPALTDLFAHGRELFLYPDKNVPALLGEVAHLLADQPQRDRVAATGLATVDAGHRASHRAAEFNRRIREAIAREGAAAIVAGRLAVARDIFRMSLRPLYLHFAESLEEESLRLAYLGAAQEKSP